MSFSSFQINLLFLLLILQNISIGKCATTPASAIEATSHSPSYTHSQCGTLKHVCIFMELHEDCDTFLEEMNCLNGTNSVSKSTEGPEIHLDRKWKLLYATFTEEIGYISHELDMTVRGLIVPVNSTEAGSSTTGVAVDYRSNVVYWTDIYSNTIYRRSMDAALRNTEVVADSDTTQSIDKPIGIAFDWITGNVYFTERRKNCIVVCSNTSENHCSILIHQENLVREPVEIVVHPNEGIMFWTQYSIKPAIMRAGMDGSNLAVLISEGIDSPLGIALDYGGSRLYFVNTLGSYNQIESVRLDGSDRRVIFKRRKSVKESFMYGVDILGDRVFWSDAFENNIKSANKKTGLQVKTHLYEKGTRFQGIKIVDIFNQPITRGNLCLNAHCSYICTLAPISQTPQFRCICPNGMSLTGNEKGCKENDVDGSIPTLAIALNNSIKLFRLTSPGKDAFTPTYPVPALRSIDAFVHNPFNNTLILSDSVTKKIYEFSWEENWLDVLVEGDLDNVKGLDIDLVAHNLYWVDAGKQTLEVMSLYTKARTVLQRNVESPSDILAASALNSLFITRKKNGFGKVEKMLLNGKQNRDIVSVQTDPVALAYDMNKSLLFWTDQKQGRIDVRLTNASITKIADPKLNVSPVDVAIYNEHVYWTENSSPFLKISAYKSPEVRKIRIAHFANFSDSIRMKITLVLRDNFLDGLEELIRNHECSHAGPLKGCSHICVLSDKAYGGECLCPDGLTLNEDGKTCVDPGSCSLGQFKCGDNTCIGASQLCDGNFDCKDGSDESAPHCTKIEVQTTESPVKEHGCSLGFLMCPNGTCVANTELCDDAKNPNDCADQVGGCLLPRSKTFKVKETTEIVVRPASREQGSLKENGGGSGLVWGVFGFVVVIVLLVGAAFVIYRRYKTRSNASGLFSAQLLSSFSES